MIRKTSLSIVAVGFSLIAFACGGEPGSEFGTGGKNGEKGSKVDVVGEDEARQDPGSLDPSLQACATSVASGELTPVTLVIMFDKSGSMAFPDKGPGLRSCDASSNKCGGSVKCIPTGPNSNDGYCADNLDLRWNPAKDALLSFFGDASSSNLKAALNFFPKGNDATMCGSSYNQASALVTLPSNGLQPALDGEFPSGSTPTLPALSGALENATALSSSGDRAVVVLVTDGRPNGCGSTPENVAAKAKSYAGKILTYVVGVGLDATENQNLDLIAAGGGTSQAIRVSTGNTKVELVNALNTIRTKVGSCSYTIPSPPSGETIDYNAVNVSIGSSALTYSKDCATGTGWHYDDPAAPKRIDLCEASCEASKGQAANVSLAFGCATKGGVIR